jgi:F-type H+-transporting ATPase subunit a
MRKLLIVLTALSLSLNSFASDEEHHGTGDRELDVKEVIIGHIINDYSWHLFTTPSGEHVSIPLPVILYSERTGFHFFLSNKFHHGHSSYNGFEIAHEGPQAGRIVEIDEQGKPYEGGLIDLSMTKVVIGLFVTMFFMLFVFLKAGKIARRGSDKAPKGVLSFVEPLILFVRDDIAASAIGKNYKRFMPYLLTVFFFIFFTNLFGLIPIPPFGANVTGNISVTASLALVTFFITTFSGNKNYWTHIVNTPGVPWWLKFPLPLMPFVEVIGVFTKPIILAIRLFANMTAGHIVMLAFITLIFIFGAISPAIGLAVSPISVLFAVFMILLDILVSFIQAFVFTLLSAIYFGMAVEEHH